MVDASCPDHISTDDCGSTGKFSVPSLWVSTSLPLIRAFLHKYRSLRKEKKPRSPQSISKIIAVYGKWNNMVFAF